MGEETLSGDGYVYYVDYFDDFMGVYICQYFNALNVYNLLHLKYLLIKLYNQNKHNIKALH